MLFAATEGPLDRVGGQPCATSTRKVSPAMWPTASCGPGRPRVSRPSTLWTCGRPASSSGQGPAYGPRSPPATSPARTATSTGEPEQAGPRPERPDSRSSTIPSGRRGWFCPWCLGPDRKWRDGRPSAAPVGKGAESPRCMAPAGREPGGRTTPGRRWAGRCGSRYPVRGCVGRTGLRGSTSSSWSVVGAAGALTAAPASRARWPGPLPAAVLGGVEGAVGCSGRPVGGCRPRRETGRALQCPSGGWGLARGVARTRVVPSPSTCVRRGRCQSAAP